MMFGVLRHTSLACGYPKTQNYQAKSRLVGSSLCSPPNILITEKEMSSILGASFSLQVFHQFL